MKQTHRVKKLQRFLFDTGRMLPGLAWSRNRRGYPGPFFTTGMRMNGMRVKWQVRMIYPQCMKCNGDGALYVGREDLDPTSTGYKTCPNCDGSMWSKKAYRLTPPERNK